MIRTVAAAALPVRPAAARRITAATNKVESSTGSPPGCRFGNAGVIADNDPDEQEKIDQVQHPADQRGDLPHRPGHDEVVRQLLAEGWEIDPEDLAAHLALPDRAHQPVRRVRHRRAHPPARSVRRAPRLDFTPAVPIG